jgi:hypothetical protein
MEHAEDGAALNWQSLSFEKMPMSQCEWSDGKRARLLFTGMVAAEYLHARRKFATS